MFGFNTLDSEGVHSTLSSLSLLVQGILNVWLYGSAAKCDRTVRSKERGQLWSAVRFEIRSRATGPSARAVRPYLRMVIDEGETGSSKPTRLSRSRVTQANELTETRQLCTVRWKALPVALIATESHHVTQRQLEAALWTAANALGGPVDPGNFKDYLFSVMFFKWVSDNWDFRHAAAVADRERLKVGFDLVRQVGTQPLTSPSREVNADVLGRLGLIRLALSGRAFRTSSQRHFGSRCDDLTRGRQPAQLRAARMDSVCRRLPAEHFFSGHRGVSTRRVGPCDLWSASWCPPPLPRLVVAVGVRRARTLGLQVRRDHRGRGAVLWFSIRADIGLGIPSEVGTDPDRSSKSLPPSYAQHHGTLTN